eukprot:GAHX01002631.1.p1 GENE.GAHX01002631.1~~GAHX01002631.1.p1  ORF type:complete len:56 (-),score=1.05 GAHX01002631.1:201-368(-)
MITSFVAMFLNTESRKFEPVNNIMRISFLMLDGLYLNPKQKFEHYDFKGCQSSIS